MVVKLVCSRVVKPELELRRVNKQPRPRGQKANSEGGGARRVFKLSLVVGNEKSLSHGIKFLASILRKKILE